MIRVALTMLAGDRAKYTGLVLGIAFTSFLVTFAMSYFCGFMTWGFALVSENPGADIWVMDPAVESAEQTINLPASVLGRVRSVEGVLHAEPLALGMAEARFPNGQFQSFQVIGVDDVTLAGAPRLGAGDASVALRLPYAAIVDAGGTEGKLETPSEAVDLWPLGAPHLQVPVRDLEAGDDLLVNDHRVQIAGHSAALPRFPPRPCST